MTPQKEAAWLRLRGGGQPGYVYRGDHPLTVCQSGYATGGRDPQQGVSLAPTGRGSAWLRLRAAFYTFLSLSYSIW